MKKCGENKILSKKPLKKQKKPSLLKESFSSVAKIDLCQANNTQLLKLSGLDGTRTRDPMRDRHVF